MMGDKMKPEKIKDIDAGEGVSLEDFVQEERDINERERLEKWPFENLYESLGDLSYLDMRLRPFIEHSVISKKECRALDKRIKDSYKGVCYLHYSTMKFKMSASSNEGGVILGTLGGGLGGAAAGAAIGTAIAGPAGTLAGALIGMIPGPFAGVGVGAGISHAWHKTVGRAGKKKYFDALDDNFRAAYQLSENIGAKIKNARISEKDFAKLSKEGRMQLLDKRRIAMDSLKKLKECYLEYKRLVR